MKILDKRGQRGKKG